MSELSVPTEMISTQRIEQLIARLDASLPKVTLDAPLATPAMTPEQFDSLTAAW